MPYDLTVDRKFRKIETKKTKTSEFWVKRYFDIIMNGSRRTTNLLHRTLEHPSFPKSYTLLDTGTKSQRKVKKLEREFGTSKGGCDCCGYIEKIPWKKDFGLCGRCSKRLNRKVGVPWNISSNV